MIWVLQGLFMIKVSLRRIQCGTFRSLFHHIKLIFNECLDGPLYVPQPLLKLPKNFVFFIYGSRIPPFLLEGTAVAVLVFNITTHYPVMILHSFHWSNCLIHIVDNTARQSSTKGKNISINSFILRLQSIPRILKVIFISRIISIVVLIDRISE